MRCNGFNTQAHAHTHKYHPQTQCVPFANHKANPNNEPSVISSSSLNNNDKNAVAFCCIHHAGDGFCCYLEQHALVRSFVCSFVRSPPKNRNCSQTRSEKETSFVIVSIYSHLFCVPQIAHRRIHDYRFWMLPMICAIQNKSKI